MQAPVALIIFNRPDLTEQVFDRIARVKPSRLFVIADGPRADRPGDAEKCAVAREIVERVDWDCEVRKNYSDVNLGCGYRPASGLSWVFEQVEQPIILEDDVLPDLTFFRFCEELLERFSDDERVMHISENNYQSGRKRGRYSYFFSRWSVCTGGWATWRRAWHYFDMEIKLWPALRETSWMLDIVEEKELEESWKKTFDRAFAGITSSGVPGRLDYWDYQWTFALWAQSGLCILSNKTMVSNVGYREDGTHTRSPNSWADLPTKAMAFPLHHSPSVIRNREADHYFVEMGLQRRRQAVPSLYGRIVNELSPFFPLTVRQTLSRLRSMLV